MPRQKSALLLIAAGAAVAVGIACSSATSPLLTGPYVGVYAMDSVHAAALATAGVPNGTLDSADGVFGTLVLKKDSFYISLTGTFARRDSGSFSISGSSVWTLSGTLFSGQGSGALVGNQLELNLAGGAALGPLYGLFTKVNLP